jgi:hypothetical protein
MSVECLPKCGAITEEESHSFSTMSTCVSQTKTLVTSQVHLYICFQVGLVGTLTAFKHSSAPCLTFGGWDASKLARMVDSLLAS